MIRFISILSKAALFVALVPAAHADGIFNAGGTGGGGSGCVPAGSATEILTDSGSGTCSSDAAAKLVNGGLSLGASGTLGQIILGNATSGTINLQPVTGALGSINIVFPATSGTVALTSQLASLPLSPANGGTGENNGSNNLTLGGSLTTLSGLTTANSITFGNGSGNLTGDSSLTYAGAGGVVTLTPAANTAQPFLITGGSTTGSGTSKVGLSVAGTLNTTGNVDGAAIFANITNTASNAATSAVDIQNGGNPIFTVPLAPTLNHPFIFSSALVTIPAIPTSAGFWFISNGGNITYFDSQAGGQQWIARRTNGTYASPSVITAGQFLANVKSEGYNGSSYPAGAEIDFSATATTNWGAGNNGELIAFNVTADGSTSELQQMTLQGSGGLSIGSSLASTDPGVGSVIMSGGITVQGITTDATHTDATVCEDTTSHKFYSGSGTLGVCLGTSSLRYKHDVEALDVGLSQIMELQPISYKLNANHGDPNKLLYGFSAEQGQTALPALTGKDAEGHPNTFDYLGVVPVLVHAVQEQQAEIEALRNRR